MDLVGIPTPEEVDTDGKIELMVLPWKLSGEAPDASVDVTIGSTGIVSLVGGDNELSVKSLRLPDSLQTETGVAKVAAIVDGADQGHYDTAQRELTALVDRASAEEVESFHAAFQHYFRHRWGARLLEGFEFRKAVKVLGNLRLSDFNEHYFRRELAFAFRGLGQDDKAYEELKGLWKELGSAPGFEIPLAELCYFRNEMPCAKALVSEALERYPGDESVKAAAAKLNREDAVESQFVSRIAGDGQFLLSFDDEGAGHISDQMVAILERAARDVDARFDYEVRDRIPVILYTPQQFNKAVHGPSWMAALYDGKIRVPAAGLLWSSEEAIDVIYHEYTHAVLHRMTGGNIPVWLNEGLAQLCEPGHRNYRYADYRARIKLPSTRKLDGGFMQFSEREAALAYEMSLSFAAYLEDRAGRAGIVRLLYELGNDVPVDDALQAAFGSSRETLEDRWKQVLTKPQATRRVRRVRRTQRTAPVRRR